MRTMTNSVDHQVALKLQNDLDAMLPQYLKQLGTEAVFKSLIFSALKVAIIDSWHKNRIFDTIKGAYTPASMLLRRAVRNATRQTANDTDNSL